MNFRIALCLLLAAMLLIPFAAAGASVELSRPFASHYTQPDPAARVRIPDLQDDQRFHELQRVASRVLVAPSMLSALGYGYALRGEEERALALMDQALDGAGSTGVTRRHILWSRGWSLINLGRYDDAARAWDEAAELHGGQPFWLPYSMALLAELRGERALAVSWYDAAARSSERWSHAEGVAQATWFWQPTEVAAMDRLFHAWLNSRS